MSTIFNHPLLFFPLVVLFLLAAGSAGFRLHALETQKERAKADSFKIFEGAILGLLSLLLGFSFSMAVARYELRQNLQIEEANAINTTWLRTAVLDEPARTASRMLLREYVPVRLQFFTVGNDRRALQDNLARTSDLQSQLWQVATREAAIHRDPFTSLYLASLNSTVDATETRTAAFENHIPVAAWVLLLFMSAVSALLVGTSVRARVLLLVLPLVIGATLTLILDLDSPRSGFIVVYQTAMERTAAQIGLPGVAQ